MNTKVIFLDIDGTLCSYDGTVPASAKQACRQARQNGHLIFLCTGRSKAEIPTTLLEIGFDGVIGAAGGYIELNGELIRHTYLTLDQQQQLKTFFNQHDIRYIFEANDALYCEPGTVDALQVCLEALTNSKHPSSKPSEGIDSDAYLSLLVEDENPLREGINKVSFLSSETSIETIRESLGEAFFVIPNTMPVFGRNSGEIMRSDLNKGVAIKELLIHLEVSQTDSVGFGDGFNDLEMLEYVGTGVAMGNASEVVKAYADYVTDRVDEDGLFNAFKKFGLI